MTDSNQQQDGDGEQYDLRIDGMTKDEMLAILSGLSLHQRQSLHTGNPEMAEDAGEAMMKLAKNNTNAVRNALLDEREHIDGRGTSEELLDVLGLEIEEGMIQPAGESEWAEVEVE